MSRPHALITGGSSGIGLAVAHRLAALGMDLTLVARREAVLDQARSALCASAKPDQRIFTVAADVSIREQAESAVARAVRELGAPQVLVTSAGIARPGRFDELAPEVFERAIAVNYLGTVYVVKAAHGTMRAGARIVMISSGAGLIGIYGYSAYSPSKFALCGFAEALHAELRHQGIGVSIAFPPDTDTPQLAEESLTKPEETRMMTGGAGVWSAEAVAGHIVRGMQSGRFAITPGAQIGALYRLGRLVSPLVQHYWAWKVSRMKRVGARPAVAGEE